MNTFDLPVIELAGTPYERGRIHGETLRSAIREFHRIFGEQFAAIVGRKTAAARDFLAEFHATTSFTSSIEAWAPGLLDEVRGVADAAGLAFTDVMELNLVDEIWASAARLRHPINAKACTAFGVAGRDGEPTWSGQNMDVSDWFEGFQALLKIRQTESRTVAFLYTFAGSIGINGMNSAGLGVSCNALPMLRNAAGGVPVMFVLRRFLEHREFEAAISFLTTAPHASGQNYLVAAPGVVRSFECSANAVEEYVADRSRVCHTNHPLASGDIEFDVTADATSSHARLASINARLGDPATFVTLAQVKRALAARDDPAFPVCRDGGEPRMGYTLGASIYELGAAPRLHLAAGPPNSTPWKTFEFEARDEPRSAV